MSDREARIARNETIARDVNESIEGSQAARGARYLRVVCECGRASCSRLIAIRVSEYEQIRADPRQFAVVHGHVVAEVEDVVSETDRYVVVAKREGTPAAIAEAEDPRR